MAGYTRQSAASIVNGQIIEDSHFNNEFNQLEAAFSGVTGHAHDGSEGNGPKINLTTSVDGVLPVANGGTGATTLQGLNDALTSGSVFKDNTFIIADFANTTKRFRFEVSAVSPATTRTFTLPDADVTISSYMGGLLNTANKSDLQAALDINTGELPISTISGLQDALDSKLNLSGGTMTGRLEIPATSAAGGMFNISPGTEGPSSPVPGDIWISDNTLYFRGTSATRALGSTGALSTVSQSEAETGTSTTTRAWTAQRVNQAIQALSPVKSVNSKTGDVSLNAADVGAASTSHTHPTATTSVDGFMSAADKSKLNGIQAGAQVNSVTSVAGKTGAVTLSTSDISGLGNAATRNVGTTSGTVAAGDDSRITGALQRSGGTMTGALTLSGNPTSNLHAATKQYVDNAVSSVPAPPVGLYTGSSAGNTNFPVGHHVLLANDDSINRNASGTVRLSGDAAYTTSGSGSSLSGTWRARGLITVRDPGGGSSKYAILMQRTA